MSHKGIPKQSRPGLFIYFGFYILLYIIRNIFDYLFYFITNISHRVDVPKHWDCKDIVPLHLKKLWLKAYKLLFSIFLTLSSTPFCFQALFREVIICLIIL